MTVFRLNPLQILLPLLLLAGCAQISDGIDWHSWTQAQTVSGMMRTERRPDDAPVTRQTLIDNFRRIAFDVENDPLGRQQSRPGRNKGPHIRKWRQPIWYDVVTLPGDRQFAHSKIVPFMLRLASATGHPIGQQSARPDKDKNANLIILYGPDALFAAFTDKALRGEFDKNQRKNIRYVANFIERWRFAPSPCAGTTNISTRSDDQTLPKGTIVADIVAIRREIPSNLFDTCVEEELAQGMGLLNDDSEVRPSLFNDDQEFALLTEHDEYLLKILYDDRLKAGMSPETAMPIVRQIVEELLPDG